MGLNPYTRFRGQPLTLNDYLAIDRTVLANERTALAYGRTALAMVIVGGTCLKFFTSSWMWALGAVFIAVGVAIAARGWVRYRHTQRLLMAALEQETGTPTHPLDEQAKASRPAEADATAPGSQVGPPQQ